MDGVRLTPCTRCDGTGSAAVPVTPLVFPSCQPHDPHKLPGATGDCGSCAGETRKYEHGDLVKVFMCQCDCHGEVVGG